MIPPKHQEKLIEIHPLVYRRILTAAMTHLSRLKSEEKAMFPKTDAAAMDFLYWALYDHNHGVDK